MSLVKIIVLIFYLSQNFLTIIHFNNLVERLIGGDYVEIFVIYIYSSQLVGNILNMQKLEII